MKLRKRWMAKVLVCALVVASTVDGSAGKEAQAAKVAVLKKAYTLTKKAGTYQGKVKVKLKAKKGYKVYYSTNGALKKKHVVKSGKVKTFTFKKTTTLSVFAVKKSKKITKATFKKKSTRNKTKKYTYRITNVVTGTETGMQTTSPNITSSATPVVSPAASTVPVTSGQPLGTPTATVTPNGTVATPAVSPVTTPNGVMPEETAPAPATSTPSGTVGEIIGGSETSTSVPTEVQAALEEAVSDSQQTMVPVATIAPVLVEDVTPQITLTGSEMTCTNLADNSDAIVMTAEGNHNILTVQSAGTYVLTGGTTEEPIKNLNIKVDVESEEPVNLVWDNLVIDNRELGTAEGEDNPVVEIAKKTTQVTITLQGHTSLTGNATYTEETASAVIYAKDSEAVLTLVAAEGDAEAGLTITDAMAKETEYGENDPTDGIASKGTLILQSGNYNISVNGDCLKGTGSDGTGGVTICGGMYELTSQKGNGIRSKNGTIHIYGGTIHSLYTAEDGINAKNYGVNITGGDIFIDQCYGDGIQGETVYIDGNETKINIATYYAYAGKNFYNSELGTGNYNTMTTSMSSKSETVNVDTGSHKGIKAGTKACTYQYETVEEGSEYIAGTTYTQEASGGLVIAGGDITIDTRNTGIKYNGGMSMGGGFGGFGGTSTSGNLSAANSDGQYIIGSPDDTIHSNHTCVIRGGTLNLYSSDDGITSPTSLIISGDSDVTVHTAYEGMESSLVMMGQVEGEDGTPTVSVYTNDDGLNSSGKTVSYVYADESEEVYTKTEQSSSSGNDVKILAGTLKVIIADDATHSFTLPYEGQEDTTGTFSASGDGIDCNGAFYAYGGIIVVYGASSGDNTPIDTEGTYHIGSGVTLLAAGCSGMSVSPTNVEQAKISFGGSSFGGGFGGGFGGWPGQSNTDSGSISISAGTTFSIQDSSSNVLFEGTATKSIRYLLYSSPSLVEGESYSVYNTTNSSSVATATASK